MDIEEVEVETVTSIDQYECQNTVEREKAYTRYIIRHNFLTYSFNPEIHIKWLTLSIHKPLPSGFISLDSSTPWILYWTLNPLRLFGYNVDKYLNEYTEALRLITLPDGVIRGSQQSIPIVAGCYSGICAMIDIGTVNAYQLINRQNTYNFLMSKKFPDGSFEMNCDSGDIDTRACYCAISTAYVLNILDDNLKQGVAEWLLKCQTYEGGFSGCPGGEAHGGYSYCAVAALALLGRIDEIDINKLLRWLIQRQKPIEGGFDGRINKLVDACYTFWQASIFGILKKYSKTFQASPVFPNVDKLLDYIILASQNKDGGYRDKPSKRPDLYHTNYALSGISSILHASNHQMKNTIRPIEPAMGVDQFYFDKACEYFRSL
ncbi:hypothetical protein ENUP19_0121G0070 [Entamoeba nuttalli]|uniref:Protein farnesyltransferase subunit beta n=2 Tax=Entamoeba nuttalli TaxID=412467 RepID=K2HSE6_ENTNP|nr:protein farnesyltransferase beta subunit, putative [Entamoeba nuttalli P19]EKE38995.1 protein farnesyltransferase beta subunit, putative [Entamoeba nuttalli P19]|eukprot:XP_008858688.1 protein farnesyltransferase beta subunit, putative [Entamoeba nuttalli P19]